MHSENHPISRRAALAGAGAFFIPAWNEKIEAAETITCTPATPTVTEGPYWVDEKLFRSDIRTDPSTGTARDGVPLTLVINVQNLSGGSCTALAGAYVDIWHCDAKGIYSDESTYNPGGGTGSVNTTGQKFLRGYQVTDDNGQVRFTTIYPGWYAGRTIHIHMRVRTYSGNTVLSNFVSQIFFDEAINDTVMAQSAYSRSSTRDARNANDMVYSVANASRMLASAAGSPAAGYTASITVGATFNTQSAAVPAITSGGVANAVSGAAGVAPGAWISIYGTNLAPATWALASSDLVDQMIPASLGGVKVQINGKPAFVQYISPAQINVLAPDDTGAGSVAVSVSNAAGSSNNITATLSPVLPGLSVQANYVRAVRYPDGAIINGTGAAESGFTTAAAAVPGDIIALYGTGFGPTDSAPQTGLVFTGAYAATNAVTVTIGGVSAEVLWAGLVGPGLYQINVKVPAAAPAGDQAVIAKIMGASSQSTALLKIGAGSGDLISNLRRLRPARPFLPLSARGGLPLEEIVRIGALFAPGQHPDTGMTAANLSQHGGSLVQLG
jgi:uncharacterized protein (TIGR03437 family)